MATKFFAFISYNSHDAAWGKRLQHKLEHYRMPAALCSQRGWDKRKPISPVFFAPTDIQPGDLSEELKGRLRSARHLIVVCSPHSARSQWVGREISYFASLGHPERIHLFIVDGVPHSGDPETECFNPALAQAGLGDVLGANVHERVSRWPWINRERAYVQLVTKLLDVEFDTLWQRHKRQLRRRFAAYAVALGAVVTALVGVWCTNQPFDAEYRLTDDSGATALPPLHDAVLTLRLDNEQKTDTLAQASTAGTFRNIPHRYLGRTVRLTVQAPDFAPLDTTLRLSRSLHITLHRDASVYGHVQFTLISATTAAPIASQPLSIGGTPATTDAAGRVSLHVPLPRQRTAYALSASFPLVSDTLAMPCTESTVVEAER